ncbi:MAG: exopolysaccharide transport family protein [Roseibium sp.]
MASGRQTYTEDDLALDLGGLLRAVGRGMRWLLPLTLIVTCATFLGLQMVSPKYLGEARILIESTSVIIPGSNRGVEEERALLDAEGVASQVQLLVSTDLARRVANKLDLASISEFGARESNSLTSGLMRMLGLGKQNAVNSAEDRVLKHFYKNLKVYRLEGSRVIAIDYSSQDPVLSAKVANTIVDQYLLLQSSAKRESTEITSAALEPQIVDLRKEVQAARQAVADFRSRADLLIGRDNIPLNQQQLAETSSNYSAAQATKAEAQAKADLIREILNSGASLETASDVLSSQLIQRLRERQVEIQSNIAELSITLLPNHPQLRALQSQLKDYDLQLRAEARKVLQGLENDAKVASQQAAALEKRLEELKTAAAKSNADQARLSELEREANAKAAQLDQLMLSFQEADTRLRAQILPADARIISRANVPVGSYAPKVFASTIIAALVTFILGCAFIVMRELLSGAALYHTNSGAMAGQAHNQTNNSDRPPRRDDRSDTSDNKAFPETYRSEPDLIENNSHAAAMSEPMNDVEYRAVNEPDQELAAPSVAKFDESRKSRRRASRSHYDHDVSPDWVGEMRSRRNKPTTSKAEAIPATMDALYAKDIDASGRIVVLSVDDEALSHDLAFELARKAASGGQSSIFMEVFPEHANPNGAEGFSDIVSGRAPFSKVVYRDAGSKAHIIESGRFAVSDDMVSSDRFSSALDAINSTYETIVVDLGAIDGTLASARMLSFADRVLIAASAPDHNHELESAANLLSHNTGAQVEIVIAGQNGSDPHRNGNGRVA